VQNLESRNSINENQNISNQWDDIAKMAKEVWRQETAKAPDYAADFYRAALDVTKDFDRRRQTLESENQKMSRTEFEKWEDALSDEIGYAKKELEKTDNTLETMAECAQHMILTTDEEKTYKTIEAQAGNYYHERSAALKQAIESSGQSEAEKDLNSIREFYFAVIDHLDYRYMESEKIFSMGVKEFDKQRTMAHNNVIKHLNELNYLARKYHVRPFTIRNFCPSDVRPKEKQTPTVADLMAYDRYSVQSYYVIAFSSEERKRQAIQERNSRYGG
jgi:hypothetical protein